jgi:hypothetical protein
MSPRRSLLLALAAALLLPACGGVDEEADEALGIDEGKADTLAKIRVSTDKKKYTPAEQIKATVRNGYSWTAVYLPGCNATTMQRMAGGTWQALTPQKMCLWEGYAVKVAPGSKLQELYGPKNAGTYRVQAGYKTGCKASQTFSQCAGTVRTATSPSVTVAPCAPVLCELYCPNGFAIDASGCEICQCKKTGCQVTGCPSTKQCTLCKTATGADYFCIPKGSMC